jgi:hypothetical protein
MVLAKGLRVLGNYPTFVGDVTFGMDSRNREWLFFIMVTFQTIMMDDYVNPFFTSTT